VLIKFITNFLLFS